MKIGYTIRYFPPFVGGAELQCYWYAVELAKKGHEVHIFTSDRQRGKVIKEKEELMDGLYVHRRKPIFEYRQRLEFNPALINEAMKHKLDILHVQGIGYPTNDAIVLLKKIFTKTKFLITPLGFGMELSDNPSWQKALMYAYSSVQKHLINPLYSSCIQINKFQHEWIIKKGIEFDKIHYIPPCIHNGNWKKVKPESFLKKYKLTGKIIITYVGRIQKYKGMDQVIKVLPHLIKLDKNIVFVMIGPDFDDTDRLKKLSKELKVEKSVVFTGHVTEEEKYQALEASEIFILPSEWEAFGMCTAEAMAKRNAPVSTRTEGGRHLIKDGENGLLFDFGNIEELKEKLSKLITDKALRKKMQAANKDLVEACRPKAVAEAHEKLYAKISKSAN